MLVSAALSTDLDRRTPSRERATPAPRRGATVPARLRLVAPVATAAASEQSTLLALLGRIGDGDERALARFDALTRSKVHGIALAILRDHHDTEEAVGDVYMQVWHRAIDYSEERSSVVGWLTTIARSRAFDQLRKRRRREGSDAATRAGRGALDAIAGTDAIVPDETMSHAERAEAARLAHRLLGALPPLQRRLLEHAYFEELTQREMAELTGLPLGTVKSHVRRSLLALRERFAAARDDAASPTPARDVVTFA